MKKIIFLFTIVLCWCSCKEDPILDTFSGEQVTYLSGIFITNEGPFQNGTGTISFFDRINNTVSQKVFQAANGGNELGNIVQSMAIKDSLAWIIVNNGDRLIITDPDFLTEKKRYQYNDASGVRICQPRYVLPATTGTGKAYITQHGLTHTDANGSVITVEPPSVLILDVLQDTFKIIETGKKPEKPVIAGGLLYVPNWGGQDLDSTVTIIRTSRDTLVKHLVVPHNPVQAVVDKNGAVWVICQGFNDFNGTITDGALVRIIADSVTVNLPLPQGGDNLVIDNDGENLFYTINGKVYKQSIDANTINETVFIDKNFYSLGLDTNTGNLLAADAGDFASNGIIYFYDAETATEIANFVVGIIPNEFIVKD